MKKVSSLFIRIVLRICIPLFILGMTFSAIELTSKVTSLNELHQIESKISLDRIRRSTSDALSAFDRNGDKSSLETTILFLNHENPSHHTDLYSLKESKFLSTSPVAEWKETDIQNAEQSIRGADASQYYIATDTKLKQVIAYSAVKLANQNDIVIIRVTIFLKNLKDALNKSKGILILMLFLFAVTGAIIGYTLAQSIVKPIKILNKATQEIMRGNLGKQVEINTGDEIELLAQTFNRMSNQLKDMKSQAMDSNPLTMLPGNQGIFQEITRRILEGHKFVLFHIDIDRFKIYNDHFGLGRGDLAIKKTVEVLKKAAREKGTNSDFVGHQGGDDFVLITKPSHAKDIAEYICHHFDKDVVGSLYPREDFERGYTMQIDRRKLAETGTEVLAKFPLIAISLAGVSNAHKDFADYFDCMNRAVQVKKEVKKIVSSSYLIAE